MVKNRPCRSRQGVPEMARSITACPAVLRWETLIPIAFNMNCNLESTHELEPLSTSLAGNDIPPLRQIVASKFEAIVT